MGERGPRLELAGIRKIFPQPGGGLEVLRGASLAVRPGEAAALVGPSGAGKSTLLHIAGLLDRPTAGAVRLGGAECAGLGDDRRTALRRTGIGFVYQFHHLLPEFSAVENVALPRMLAGVAARRARRDAEALLDRVGLAARAGHRPARLSGGERQRVAIARALANGPGLVIADEPTGNLDRASAEAVFALLLDVVRRGGAAALVATHNPDLAARMDRRLALEDGVVREAG